MCAPPSLLWCAEATTLKDAASEEDALSRGMQDSASGCGSVPSQDQTEGSVGGGSGSGGSLADSQTSGSQVRCVYPLQFSDWQTRNTMHPKTHRQYSNLTAQAFYS